MTVRTRAAQPAAPAVRRKPAAPAAAPAVGRPAINKPANTFFLILAVLGCLHASAMLGVEGWRFQNSQVQIARLTADIAALERERESLEAVVLHANDAGYREQLARCLGFVRPGETRYITVTGVSEPQPAGADWCQ
jgi:cell division protein FtsB